MKSQVFQKIKCYCISCASSPDVLEIPTMKNRLTSEAKAKGFIHDGAVLLEKQITSFKDKGGKPITIYLGGVFQKIKSYFFSSTSSPDVLKIPTMKNRLTLEEKERNFIHNGAVLLEKQIASFEGKGGEPVRIYSEEDIYHATNGYEATLVIGQAIATVYRGTIDDRMVAIKTPQGLLGSDEMIDFFLNQITIKQQISHKNVVQLYGCCLETHIPILVHELMHGSLFGYLHGCSGSTYCWITWENRLHIATEIAYALSYMHCAASKPIVHRDVKSSNIFLDECLSAKLSNFGFSISISPDRMKPMWPPVGSRGYIDPEYVETLLVTEKCDVYSFGVVMMELLTGIDPEKLCEQNSDLVVYFVSNMRQTSLLEIVDKRLLQEGSIKTIQHFAELAMRCIQLPGDRRPTMEEIVLELRQMQKSLVSW